MWQGAPPISPEAAVALAEARETMVRVIDEAQQAHRAAIEPLALAYREAVRPYVEELARAETEAREAYREAVGRAVGQS